MRRFRHISAESVEEATAILAELGEKARLIAGGTDLLGELKDRILPEADYPELLVDIKRIPGLGYIRDGDGVLHIGALTRLGEVAADEMVRADYPALAEAARRTASPNIRHMGTVAGNICQNNRCWYYWVPDNRFDCLRKGGRACYALTGDARYHSIFGAARVGATACSRACPISIDIATYLSQIREGDVNAAATTLLQSNPLAAVTGRVCPHWCQIECARGEFDESVSVREIERFLGDHTLSSPKEFFRPPARETTKRVAIVGSGPAGLSAAYFLRQAGHAVSIFERMPNPGGLLAYGIPPYRLPRDILRKQLAAIFSTGVKLNLGEYVDRDRLEDLVREYDAVFVASGAWGQTEVGITGEQCLSSGVDFLRSAYEHPEAMIGKTVGVIGGGNTAIDVARSLLRLGARPVVYYRRTRDEMPALDEEVVKAEREGVRFEFLTQPVSASLEARLDVDQKTGGVALTCCRMELGEPDESGRPRPVPIEGTEYTVQCDAVMKAIVERPDYSLLPPQCVDERGRLRIDEEGGSLGEGIFAGGDFVTGPATVAQAVSTGRKAALAIERSLQSSVAPTDEGEPVCSFAQKFSGSCLQQSGRVKPPELSVAERVQGLHVEETGTLDAEAIRGEAERCFNCGCVAANSSDLAPALIALGATIKTSARVIDAEEFSAAGINSSTILGSNEMVLEVEIPRPSPTSRSAFIKFALRKSIDFPVVNCAAVIDYDKDGMVRSARICLNSVYALPVRATNAEARLVGMRLDGHLAEQAAGAAVREALPLLNNSYKIQIARTLVKRAILACAPAAVD